MLVKTCCCEAQRNQLQVSYRHSLDVTDPNAIQIEPDTVRGDPLVVSGLEDEIVPLAIGKPLSQVDHGLLELFRHEHLVRQGGEREVEVVA